MRYFILIFSFLCFINNFIASGQTTCDLLIKNVNIIDVVNGRNIINQDVQITEDKIIKIQPSTKQDEPAKKVIDGTGKYLIPGLWDMHTHNWWQIHFSDAYIANGVLGVRNMYTPMQFIQSLKDSIDKGLVNGPKYYAAGRVVEGTNPEFPDWLVVDSVHKIKPALDTLEMEGSDFVKVYNKIPRDVYFELMKEAHARGMRVEGHLPIAVSATEASEAGQRSIEHLLGIPDLCSHDTLFKHRTSDNWFSTVMKLPDLATMHIDENLARKQFAVLKKNQTSVCPTLVVWYSYLHPDTLFENDPDFIKLQLPDDIKGYWNAEITKYRKKDIAWKETALMKYENLKRVTRLMFESGVPMLTGTDAINPYCLPGYGLHKEFLLLKECGIPDKDILKMATYNAAKFLELPDYGEVKQGMIASLVLLNENPLNDIRHTKSIHLVVLKGKVISPR